MTTELVEFSLEPKTLEEAMKLAEIIAKSDLVPKDFQGKPGNVLIAVQMGKEIGLKPMQALQSIAVINGRPCVWGDGALALVRASGLLEDFREDMDEKALTATCSAKRKGQPTTIVRSFSQAEAKVAGLWDKKPSPWQTYPKRMLQMRARAFVLRDGFADVLKGLAIAEEQGDIETVDTEALPAPARVALPPAAVRSDNGAGAEASPGPESAAPTTTTVDWRKITAKFNSLCGGCGNEIKTGEDVYFDPAARKAWHTHCR